ncbi:hypothetical protein AUR64_09230 [Haloprofundus marisrubri]|uniref:Uncharacterized protein n=1 Tax=Haloprofundus marisrubri TaxID=1514971 RepID=A0A0W1R8S9_9EURY|nr:hypothetical protein [Haloprofundus marisrubri]KTG09805.1 hypothetical protein AUR64_09230 [Haloprofundus marisrubri]
MASPTPTAVKRALCALATEQRHASENADTNADTDADTNADTDAGASVANVADARETIAAGNDALESVESAAALAAEGGFERVRDAVEVATRADDVELRRVGETVLASIAAYRRAATVETPRVGTHLGGDGQRADR